MIKFDVMALAGSDGSEPSVIARLEAPVLPRVGDTVSLYGPQFGDEHTPRHKDMGESIFTVIDVIFRARVAENKDGTEPCGIEIHVDTAMVARGPMKLWCVCKNNPPVRVEGEPDTCGDCGHRLPEASRDR